MSSTKKSEAVDSRDPSLVLAVNGSSAKRKPQRLIEKRRKLVSDAEKLAQIGSFEWDIPNNSVVWSDGLYAIYGLTPDQFDASFEAFLAQVHPDDRERVQSTIRTAHSDHQPFSIEERIVRPDGKVRTLRSKGEVVVNRKGEAVRILGVCQDITEAKRAEKLVNEWNRTLEHRVQERTHQLKQSNEKLEQALEQLKTVQHQMVVQAKMATVGHLVAGIAHEVNTPVGTIKGATDIVARCVTRIADALRTGGLDHDASLAKVVATLEDNSGAAVRAGDRLAEIVERLKMLVQLDDVPPSRLGVHDALDGVLTLVRHETDDRVTITKDYGELPPIWCRPGQLKHALLSVLLNASQAIETSGDIRITTWRDDRNVFIRIQDTGRGIPSEKLDGLFEIGFTARSSKMRLGTGLFNAYNISATWGGHRRREQARSRHRRHASATDPFAGDFRRRRMTVNNENWIMIAITTTQLDSNEPASR